MHESRLTTDLLAQMGLHRTGTITGVRLRVGALAAVSPAALRHGIAAGAQERWGRAPHVEVEVGDDPAERGALSVMLLSVTVEG